jgi:hypothetical protein
MSNKATIVGLAVLLCFAGPLGADDDKPTRGERRLADINKKYVATGEVKACIGIRRARGTKIIDDKTIFFESLGRRGYMNHLNGKCAGLAREERFSFSTSITRLCRGEIITVLDGFGRPWGSCSLGEFEEMKKKSKAEIEATESESKNDVSDILVTTRD